MQKLLILFIFGAFPLSIKAQNPELKIQNQKLAKFIKLEEKHSGVLIKNKSTYIESEGMAQPLIYRRKQSKIPDLLTYYFYFEKDSVIQYILYEWDEANFYTEEELSKKSNVDVMAFINKYKKYANKSNIDMEIAKVMVT